MSSRLEQVAVAVRALADAGGSTGRSLEEVQREAHRQLGSVPSGLDGRALGELLRQAAQGARSAEAALADFVRFAQAFADRLARGGGGWSMAGVGKGVINVVSVASITSELFRQVVTGSAALPQQYQFIPSALSGPVIAQQLEPGARLEKEIQNLYDSEELRRSEGAERTWQVVADGAPTPTTSLVLQRGTKPRPPKKPRPAKEPWPGTGSS